MAQCCGERGGASLVRSLGFQLYWQVSGIADRQEGRGIRALRTGQGVCGITLRSVRRNVTEHRSGVLQAVQWNLTRQTGQ
jgi:hypothetical protein